MRTTVLVYLLMVLLVAAAAAAGAQEAAVPVAGETASEAELPLAPIEVARDGNYAVIDGEPTLLVWARGVQSPEDVAAYARAGFTVLYVSLSPGDEESLAQAQALIDAARPPALPFVIGIDTEAALFDQERRRIVEMEPLSQDYRDQVAQVVDAVVARFGDEPHLIGWVLEGLSLIHISEPTRPY